MTTPDAESARLIHSNVPCLRCGYNLRELSVAGLCPECGYPIGKAVLSYARGLAKVPKPLEESPPRWLCRLAFAAATILLVGIGVGAVEFAVGRIDFDVEKVNLITNCVASGLVGLAMWIIADADPSEAVSLARWLAQMGTRAAIAYSVLVPAVMAAVIEFPYVSFVRGFDVVLALAGIGAGIVATMATSWFLVSVARRRSALLAASAAFAGVLQVGSFVFGSLRSRRFIRIDAHPFLGDIGSLREAPWLIERLSRHHEFWSLWFAFAAPLGAILMGVFLGWFTAVLVKSAAIASQKNQSNSSP